MAGNLVVDDVVGDDPLHKKPLNIVKSEKRKVKNGEGISWFLTMEKTEDGRENKDFNHGRRRKKRREKDERLKGVINHR